MENGSAASTASRNMRSSTRSKSHSRAAASPSFSARSCIIFLIAMLLLASTMYFALLLWKRCLFLIMQSRTLSSQELQNPSSLSSSWIAMAVFAFEFAVSMQKQSSENHILPGFCAKERNSLRRISILFLISVLRSATNSFISCFIFTGTY